MELDKKNTRKILLIIAFAIGMFAVFTHLDIVWTAVKNIFEILSPFITGGAIAFILYVPMRFYEKIIFRKAKKKGLLRLKRPVCLTLSLLSFFGVIFIVLFVIVPELSKTIVSLADQIPGFITRAEAWLQTMLNRYPDIQKFIADYEIDWAELGKTAFSFFNNIGTVLGSTVSVVGSILTGILNTIIAIIFAFYLLFNKENLARQCNQLMYARLPIKVTDHIISICRLSCKTFANFLSGQCLEAVILGTMFFITMTIFRFPYALLVGVLVAFTALIPIFGAFIGCIISMFLIFVISPVQAFWFLVLFLALQQIESNLVYPRVVGGSVGLPSLWVLVAVATGAKTMGVMGMLIFIPIFSILYTLLRRNTLRRLAIRKIPREKWEKSRPIEIEKKKNASKNSVLVLKHKVSKKPRSFSYHKKNNKKDS